MLNATGWSGNAGVALSNASNTPAGIGAAAPNQYVAPQAAKSAPMGSNYEALTGKSSLALPHVSNFGYSPMFEHAAPPYQLGGMSTPSQQNYAPMYAPSAVNGAGGGSPLGITPEVVNQSMLMQNQGVRLKDRFYTSDRVGDPNASSVFRALDHRTNIGLGDTTGPTDLENYYGGILTPTPQNVPPSVWGLKQDANKKT